MKNTFTGMVKEVVNTGILFVIAEVLGFRVQLTMRDEFKSQSGWNDSLNGYVMRRLEAIRQTVARVTYSPSESDPEATRIKRIQEAKDTSTTLAAAFGDESINNDDLVMPVGAVPSELSYDLSGAHPDYPQPTAANIPNNHARALVTKLDQVVTTLTRLDSRTQPSTINAPESAQIQAMLGEAYAIAKEKGGEANRADTPSGVTPSQEVATFNHDGSLDPEPAK